MTDVDDEETGERWERWEGKEGDAVARLDSSLVPRGVEWMQATCVVDQCRVTVVRYTGLEQEGGKERTRERFSSFPGRWS